MVLKLQRTRGMVQGDSFGERENCVGALMTVGPRMVICDLKDGRFYYFYETLSTVCRTLLRVQEDAEQGFSDLSCKALQWCED